MKPRFLATLGWLFATLSLPAQVAPRFTEVRRQTDGGVVLQVALPVGRHFRLDVADHLAGWRPLLTARSTGTNSFADGGAAYAGERFYRAIELDEAAPQAGDHVATAAGEVLIRPVNHASLVLRWQERWIYNDPVGGLTPYQSFPRADLILISHGHGDHFDAATLNAVKQAGTLIVAPAAVYGSLSATLKAQAIPLANGAVTNVLGLTVEAVPAYNANHPKGAGNGYVVTLGGRRFYFAGDTGNTAEMRSLTDIEVAFLCMNQPFTMTVADAVHATRAFRPRVVYPYHFRNQDGSLANLTMFKQQVGTDLGIEVRVRKWY